MEMWKNQLSLFAKEMLYLVSNGENEQIVMISKHMREGDLIQYLSNKYNENLHNYLVSPHVDVWNEKLSEFSDYVLSDSNDHLLVAGDNGLLVVVSVILTILCS